MGNQKSYKRNKKDSEIGEIIVDRDLCIGAASCLAVSGGTYELDGENKAIVKDANTADDEETKAAAASCPTKAIILKDRQGKQIYP